MDAVTAIEQLSNKDVLYRQCGDGGATYNLQFYWQRSDTLVMTICHYWIRTLQRTKPQGTNDKPLRKDKRRDFPKLRQKVNCYIYGQLHQRSSIDEYDRWQYLSTYRCWYFLLHKIDVCLLDMFFESEMEQIIQVRYDEAFVLNTNWRSCPDIIRRYMLATKKVVSFWL